MMISLILIITWGAPQWQGAWRGKFAFAGLSSRTYLASICHSLYKDLVRLGFGDAIRELYTAAVVDNCRCHSLKTFPKTEVWTKKCDRLCFRLRSRLHRLSRLLRLSRQPGNIKILTFLGCSKKLKKETCPIFFRCKTHCWLFSLGTFFFCSSWDQKVYSMAELA